MKSKKSALLLSFTSLLICFAMLVGSTFAWFTDTATTGVNKITSGNLDLEVYHKIDGEGKLEKINDLTNLFDNVEGNPIRWEPGAKAEETFVIKNEGNLALKYCFAVSYANATKTPADKTLADALTVSTATGEDNISDENRGQRTAANTALGGAQMADFSHEEYLLPGEYREIKMTIQWVPSANDNDFNVAGGLSIELGINVLATQYTYEKDSISDQYDAQAEYPVLPVKVSSGKEIRDAIAELNQNGGKLILDVGSTITKELWTIDITKGELTVKMNENTLNVGSSNSSGTPAIRVGKGARVMLENGTVQSGRYTSMDLIKNEGGELILKNVTLKNNAKNTDFSVSGVGYYSPTCLYVKDGTVTITGKTNISGSRAIYVEHKHDGTETSPKVIIDQGMTGEIKGTQETNCIDKNDKTFSGSCNQRTTGFIQDLR